MLRRRGPARAGAEPPQNPYLGLRQLALNAVAEGLVPRDGGHPDVAGAVVDVPASGGSVTIVALTDGTTSMYTSVGGGTVGAGAHEPVARATNELLDRVQAQLDEFPAGSDDGLPPAGMVRMHVLSPSGGRLLDLPEDRFWGRAPSDLLPVITAVQAVIAALREASGSQSGG